MKPCDKTGIMFDGSARQKNHPRVSVFLNEANTDGRHYVGAYAAALQICADIKAAGITDIDEAMSYANEAFSAWKNGSAKPIIRRTNGDIIREKKAASRQRDAQNAILRQHGYRWHKEDAESMDAFGANAFESTYGGHLDSVWILTDPDGREVSVAEAFRRIGVEIPQ